MQKIKKHPSKNQLLEWANTYIPSDIRNHSKIEQLGNGVAYLYILNHQYPGCLSGVKFCKRPSTQYQSLTNLKVLNNIFQKIGIKQPIDISKISKMKFQQNLNLLQWFWQNQDKLKSTHSLSVSNTTSVGCSRIGSIKAPEKLILTKPQKSNKMEVQENIYDQLKTLVSPTKYLNQIKQVMDNENINNPSTKIDKIRQILTLPKKYNQSPSFSKYSTKDNRDSIEEISHMTQKNDSQQSQRGSKLSITEMKAQTKSISQKSQSLQQKYQNYLKSAYKPHGIKIIEDNKQIYEYEQQRLTDNSILLNYSPSSANQGNSQRKSMASQTDLLGQ